LLINKCADCVLALFPRE